MKKKNKATSNKKSTQAAIKKEVRDFFQVNGRWTLLVRTLLLLALIVIEWVVIYFISKKTLEEKLSTELNNTLLSVVVALFALQIAIYTLILQPYRNLQDGIYARKLIYIKAVKTNELPFVEHIYNSFDESMLYNDRIFRFVACELYMLLVYVGIVVIITCIPTISLLCSFTFLLSNLIFQFLLMSQFLNMLHSLFIKSKREIKGMMDITRDKYLSAIKTNNTNSNDVDIASIVLKIDEMYEDRHE